MIDSKEYAKRILAILKLKHIRIGDVEHDCGVAKGYLSRVIANDSKMTLDLAQKLAEQTGYTFIDILTRDIPKEWEMFEVKKKLRELEERAKGLRKLLNECEVNPYREEE